MTLPEAVVTPMNADSLPHVSSDCVSAVSDFTLPDEPPSSLLAIVSGDEPNTQSAVTVADDVTESTVINISAPVSSMTSFITSSSYAAVTESYLPCGRVPADGDMVTTSDCLLHAVPEDDDEEMVPDEQIDDWDHEVFDP